MRKSTQNFQPIFSLFLLSHPNLCHDKKRKIIAKCEKKKILPPKQTDQFCALIFENSASIDTNLAIFKTTCENVKRKLKATNHSKHFAHSQRFISFDFFQISSFGSH